MDNENFIKDNLWIAIMAVLVFTAFVGYTLNKNIDSEEVDEEEDELNKDKDED